MIPKLLEGIQGKQIKMNENPSCPKNLQLKLLHVDKYLNSRNVHHKKEQFARTLKPNAKIYYPKHRSFVKENPNQNESVLNKLLKKNSVYAYEAYSRNPSGTYTHQNGCVGGFPQRHQKLNLSHRRMKTEPQQKREKCYSVGIKTQYNFRTQKNLQNFSKVEDIFSPDYKNHEQTRESIKDLTFYSPSKQKKFKKKIMKKLSENIQTRSYLCESSITKVY